MKPRNKNTNPMSGFTLLEVLIAMVILAIGALGAAALQFKGLRYSTDANFRSTVNFLAFDIADTMRLNRANAASYVQNYVTGSGHGACTMSTGANAANDLNCWYDRVDNGLPAGGSANITGPDANNMYTIVLMWNDREGESHTVNYTFMP